MQAHSVQCMLKSPSNGRSPQAFSALRGALSTLRWEKLHWQALFPMAGVYGVHILGVMFHFYLGGALAGARLLVQVHLVRWRYDCKRPMVYYD